MELLLCMSTELSNKMHLQVQAREYKLQSITLKVHGKILK